MNNRERFLNIMNFRPVDRLPAWELVVWWDKTIERWKKEGLPGRLQDESDIRDWFGLARHKRFRIRPSYPEKDVVFDKDTYNRIKGHIFPEIFFEKEKINELVVQQTKGETVVWLQFDGFFWFPRAILGVEKHFYTFYDNPDLIREINSDLLRYNLEIFDRFCEICVPDFVVISEDMSYKNGPMISKPHFERFVAPHYKKIIPRIKERGGLIFVDSDGNVHTLAGWFSEVGVEGLCPLEIRAQNDIYKLRQEHPQLRIIGGYDKMVMDKDEKEMRKEFERIFPAMKAGGYIPATDHQVPPGVSLANYKIYLNLLKEYCNRI